MNRSRLTRSIALTVALSAVIVAVHRWAEGALIRVDVFGGLLILAELWAIALLHWRKKLTTLPLWRVSLWVQFHVHLAWLTVLGFGLHIGWKLPSGWLEGTLFLLFLTTAGSGMLGLYLTRTIPKRLARVGE